MKELWKSDIHVSEARKLWHLCAVICCASHKIHQTFNCLNTAVTVIKYVLNNEENYSSTNITLQNCNVSKLLHVMYILWCRIL